MPTLWEMLWNGKKKEVIQELLYNNPLQAKINDIVKIDMIELKDFTFKIEALREVRRVIGDKNYPLADYDLASAEKNLRLRLIPCDGEISHKVILLEKIDECEYNKDFHEGLDYSKNKGEFTEGEDMYWRVDDVQSEWNAKTFYLHDNDKSGKIDENEVEKRQISYWDFWRETEDEAGNKILEFYVVEMDKETGWFEFWKGPEINTLRISVIN